MDDPPLCTPEPRFPPSSKTATAGVAKQLQLLPPRQQLLAWQSNYNNKVLHPQPAHQCGTSLTPDTPPSPLPPFLIDRKCWCGKSIPITKGCIHNLYTSLTPDTPDTPLPSFTTDRNRWRVGLQPFPRAVPPPPPPSEDRTKEILADPRVQAVKQRETQVGFRNQPVGGFWEFLLGFFVVDCANLAFYKTCTDASAHPLGDMPLCLVAVPWKCGYGRPALGRHIQPPCWFMLLCIACLYLLPCRDMYT